MKRLLVFVIGVIGLGMMLSGCTFGSHYIKESYIQKNYINKVKVPKSKVVGDRNIKFYVGKVKDERKDKYVWMKRTYFWIPAGSIHFKDICGTVKYLTERALKQTGWGVVNSKDNANFIVDTVIRDFMVHWELPFSKYTIKNDIYILSDDINNSILRKQIYEKKTIFKGSLIDLTGKFAHTVGNLSTLYYTALINYFSSPEFVKTIKKAYVEENDDSTKSVGDK